VRATPDESLVRTRERNRQRFDRRGAVHARLLGCLVAALALLVLPSTASATPTFTAITGTCPVGPTTTQFSPVSLPFSGATTADCNVTFNTNTTSAMLVAYQSDGADTAMYSPEAKASLDSSFGTGGTWTQDLGRRFDKPVDSVLSNGWLYTAGVSATGKLPHGWIARYCTATVKVAPCTGAAADGLIDTSYGTNGIATYDSPEGSFDLFGLAVDSTGRAYATGWIWNWASANDVIVLRFTAAGALDTTWDGDGALLVDVASNNDTGRAIAVQPDDKVVVAGTASGDSKTLLFRLTTTGTLDATFGTGGMYTDDPRPSVDRFTSLTLDGSGNIYAGGSTFSSAFVADFRVTKFSSTGVPVAGYGTGGTLVWGLGSWDEVLGIRLDSSGRVVVGGTTNPTNGWDFYAARLTTAGALDTTFNTPNGYVTLDRGGGCPWFCNEEFRDFTLDSVNRPIIAGVTDSALHRQSLIARFTAAGVLDTTFNTTGYQSADVADAGAINEGTAVVADAANKPTMFAWGQSAATRSYPLVMRRFTAAGALDATLNGARHTIPYQMSLTNGDDRTVDTVVQPNGRVLAVSDAYDGPNGYGATLVRLTSSGALDATFGTAGTARVTPMDPHAMTIDASGNIYVCGHNNPSLFDGQLTIYRFTSAGAVDTAWGPNGDGSFHYNPSGGDSEYCEDIAIQADGKPVIVGYSKAAGARDLIALRLTTTGTLDTTWNAAGAVPGTTTVDFGAQDATVCSVSLDPSGRAMAFGGINGFAAVARFTTAGVLDTTFSGDGMSTYQIGTANTFGRDGIVTSTGLIYQSNDWNWFWGESDARIAKLDPTTGLPITTYGIDGTGASSAFGFPNGQSPNDMDLDPNANPLVAASHDNTGSDLESNVLRASTAGYTTMDYEDNQVVGAADQALTVRAQTDGKVLYGGYRTVVSDANSYVARLDHNEIPDYQAGVADWATGTGGMFGMCLRAVSAPGSANDADTWATGTCAVGGTGWHAVPQSTTPGLATKVAECLAGCASTNFTLSFRFGLRVPNTTPPGSYRAPITFEAIDPNVTYTNTAPAVPTLTAPTSGSAVGTGVDVYATFNDPDPGDTGQLTVQWCANSSCSIPFSTVTSSPGIANGATGTAYIPCTLSTNTTYWWRPKATDSGGLSSAYSATWSFTTSSTPQC
jgi:uncharacterized delta-60 repeat protein